MPLVAGTALLTFLLARLLWPERRFLQIAAAAFFVFTPVVIKIGAVFHNRPEAGAAYAIPVPAALRASAPRAGCS